VGRGIYFSVESIALFGTAVKKLCGLWTSVWSHKFCWACFRTLPTPYFTLLLAEDCQCRSEEGSYYGRIHLSGSHKMRQLPGYQMFGLSADTW